MVISRIAKRAPRSIVSCMSALVLPRRHLEPASDTPGEQRAACIEDWIAPTFGQDLAGIHHPKALAALG